MQFLKENNLANSLQTLQNESGISLNMCDSTQVLESDILAGRWQKVLITIKSLKLPNDTLAKIYEQIILELLELNEKKGSKYFFELQFFQSHMRQHNKARLRVLESMLVRNYFDVKEAYPNNLTKEKSRAKIAKLIIQEINNVTSSRLLTLLGQSLKWQQHQGILPPGQVIDIFRGKTTVREQQEENIPLNLVVSMEFAESSHPESAIFSEDGQFLITGSADGFVEIWNYSTGKIRKDLVYQANNKWIVMDSAVLSMACSSDSTLLATGSQSGNISIWNIASGECVQSYEGCHTEGITSLLFYKEDSQILSSSFDSTIKLLSIKSQKVLKIFRGHNSFVYDICCIPSKNTLISASGDGSVKLWNFKTAECTNTFRPMDTVPIYKVIVNPSNPEEIFICPKANTVLLLNLSGQIVHNYSNGKSTDGDFVSLTVSHRGQWVYCLCEDNILYCFNSKNQKLERTIKVHEKTPIGLSHHNFHNFLATFGEDLALNVWSS